MTDKLLGSEKLPLTGPLIARNAFLNAVGQALPLAVGLMVIPLVVRGLGPDRFGLLSMAWVVMGYFTLFDLGLGRATTKVLAELLGSGLEEDVPRVIWTAVLSQAVLGLFGALTLGLLTPLLVAHALRIPGELREEAKWTFYLLALGIPVALISGSLSGALEAQQRFDLVNAVRVPSSAMMYLLPLVGIQTGMALPGIVSLILGWRMIALMILGLANIWLNPALSRPAISPPLLKRLLSFGCWATISNVVGPILVYLDRFLIGSMVSVAAVGYYVAPYEAITRLWIIPASLTSVLFPTFSFLEGIGDRAKVSRLFFRSLKFQVALLFPITLTIILFAWEGLTIWLGEAFARQSAPVLQILAVGVFVNSLSQIPFALLQGVGRPDLTAKFHLVELPAYGVLAFWLVREMGIGGAALAWTLRVSIDGLLLFGAAWCWVRFEGFGQWARRVGGGMAALAFLAGLLGGTKTILLGGTPSGWHLLLLGAGIAMLVGFAWGIILDGDDRRLATFFLIRLK